MNHILKYHLVIVKTIDCTRQALGSEHTIPQYVTVTLDDYQASH